MVWWVRSDVCSLITANMTVGLLLYGEVVICYSLLYSWMGGVDANIILFSILIGLALWSHSKCQYSDPGAVPPLGYRPESQNSLLAPNNNSDQPLMVGVQIDSVTTGVGNGAGAGNHSISTTGIVPIDSATNPPLTPTNGGGASGDVTSIPVSVHGTSAILPSSAGVVVGTSAIVSDAGTGSGVAAATTPKGKLCRSCKTAKPYRAHHCSLCGRCVVKMDHHCPWVNNCVAFLNQKYFLLFLVYTFLSCVYSALLLIVRFITCSKDPKSCSVSGGDVALCIGVFIEALIFGIFTCTMFFDQLFAIFDNTPGIDAMQRRRTGRRKPKWESLKDVWGESNFGWRWFLPLGPTQKLLADFHYEVNRYDDPSSTANPTDRNEPKQR